MPCSNLQSFRLVYSAVGVLSERKLVLLIYFVQPPTTEAVNIGIAVPQGVAYFPNWILVDAVDFVLRSVVSSFR